MTNERNIPRSVDAPYSLPGKQSHHLPPMRISIEGNLGTGKCLGYGQGVLLSSGTTKEVQDIVVGDQLMGEDSLPRTVLDVCHGREQLFNIVPRTGPSFTATRNHVLCLQVKGLSGNFEMTVQDFLRLDGNQRSRCRAYRVGVDFPYTQPAFDPWMVGYWLGGARKGTALTPNVLIKQKMQQHIALYGLVLTDRWTIESKQPGGENSFLDALRHLDILHTSKVPADLKCSSRLVRQALLAGMLDACAQVTLGGFVMTHTLVELAEDTVFVARSLGLACHQGTMKGGALRILIRGRGLELLPTVRRPHHLRKNVLRTGIRVEPAGDGNYYGFETDGNHRFLLSDFTVTHNSSLLKSLSRKWRVFEEPVEDWQPILGLFYTQPHRWCLHMNLQALLSFTNVPDDGVVISERSPLSCKEVFSRLGKNEGVLSEKEWALFCDIYKSTAWVPDVIIFLASSTSTCLQRIQQRARPGEEPVTHDYLCKVQFAHNVMLRWYGKEVHLVDATQDAAAVLARVEDILDAYKL